MKNRMFKAHTDDFDKMCKLVIELNAKDECDWSLGRMYGWKYGRWSKRSQDDLMFEEQAELFFDDNDDLIGIIVWSCVKI